MTIWGDHSDCLTFLQEAEVELENIQGNISEWIAQPNVERKVRRVFVNFLLTYEDEDGSKVYRQRIQDMQSSKCGFRSIPGIPAPHALPLNHSLTSFFLVPNEDGRKSLEVVYTHISLNKPTEVLASWLADDPQNTLKALNKV